MKAGCQQAVLECLSAVMGNLSAAGMGSLAAATATGGALAGPAGAAVGMLAGSILAACGARRISQKDQERLNRLILAAADSTRQMVDEGALDAAVDQFDGAMDRQRLLKHLIAVRRLSQAQGRSLAAMEESLHEARDFYRCFERHLVEHRSQLDGTLRALTGLGEEVREQLLALLNPQPQLRLPRAELDPQNRQANRFHYSYRRTDMFGRDEEMRRLREFVDSQRPFAWWLITGPGGLGKSRLAYELCLELEEAGDWRCGFVAQDRQGEPAPDWQPLGPTLIVLDYVGQRLMAPDSRIRALMCGLSERNLDYPVRLLLVERSADDQWYETLMCSDGEGEAIRRSQHAEPYRLAALGDDALWRIVQAVTGETQAKGQAREKVLELLKQVDHECRPLYAAFAAEAVADGKDLTQWSQADLVKHVLERERLRRWKAEGVDEKHLNLVALATICGGIGPEAPDPLQDEAIRDLMPENLRPEWLRTVTGEATATRYAPLEPDPLGECFVLEHLLKGQGVHKKWPKRGLLSAAWRWKPAATASFIFRAQNDFSGHETMGLLREPADQDEKCRRMWALLAANEVGLCGQCGDAEGAFGWCDDLRQFTEQHPELALRAEWARALVNRGICYSHRGHDGDWQLEVDDYTAVIKMDDAPTEVKAMALVNRGIAYSRRGQDGDWQLAADDQTAVIEMGDASAEAKATALITRGIAYSHRGQDGDWRLVVNDYTAVIEMDDAPSKLKAQALVYRGACYSHRGQDGDWQLAVDDYTAVIKMDDAPTEQKAEALVNRGYSYTPRGHDGDWQLAMNDYAAVIEMDDAPSEQKAKALFNRGVSYSRRGQNGGWRFEVDDFTAVIRMNDAPPEHKAKALFSRGVAYGRRGRDGDWQLEMNDYTAVIEMDDAPGEQKAKALFNRAVSYSDRGQEGDWQLAVNDFAAVIEMDDAPPEQKADALVNRGVSYSRRGQEGDCQLELDDFTAVIEMKNAPAVQKAEALFNRGVCYSQRGQAGDGRRAMNDFTAAIAMDDAPAELKARARELLNILKEEPDEGEEDGGATKAL